MRVVVVVVEAKVVGKVVMVMCRVNFGLDFRGDYS